MPKAKTLDKEQSRKRMSGLRKLWKAFNPIGADNLPDTEYAGYCGDMMRLLESDASDEEMTDYMNDAVYETMGLSKTPEQDAAIQAFIQTSRDWFNKHWADTIA